jgi:hypothetical protein
LRRWPARLAALAFSVVRTVPTAPIAAGSLVVGYAVAVASGSRPLGGAVLAAGGLLCALLWLRRRGLRTALELTAAGLGALVLSHVLALATGAWPAVVAVSIAMAGAAWVRADVPSGTRSRMRAGAGIE